MAKLWVVEIFLTRINSHVCETRADKISVIWGKGNIFKFEVK